MYVLDKKIPGFLGIGYKRGLGLGSAEYPYDIPVPACGTSTASIQPGEVEWQLHQLGYYEIAQVTTPTPTPVVTKTIYRGDAVKYGVDRAIWKWELQNARGLGYSLWDAVVNYAIQEGNLYLKGSVSGLSGMKGLSGLGQTATDYLNPTLIDPLCVTYPYLCSYTSDDYTNTNYTDTTGSSIWDWGGWSYVAIVGGELLKLYGYNKLTQQQINDLKKEAEARSGGMPTISTQSDYDKAVQLIRNSNPGLSDAQVRDMLNKFTVTPTQNKQDWIIPALLVAGAIIFVQGRKKAT